MPVGTSNTLPITPALSTRGSSVDNQATYSRRLYVKNISKFIVFNDEWYVADCWENERWYQNGKQLAPGLEPTLLPGQEAEFRTDYVPCTENPNLYLFFTTNKAAVDTCAFVLTGHAAGHHTQLHVVAYGVPLQHTACACRHNGRCHYQDNLAPPPPRVSPSERNVRRLFIAHSFWRYVFKAEQRAALMAAPPDKDASAIEALGPLRGMPAKDAAVQAHRNAVLSGDVAMQKEQP